MNEYALSPFRCASTFQLMIFFLIGQFFSIEEDHLVDPAFINRI
jgi:hypothetical protein